MKISIDNNLPPRRGPALTALADRTTYTAHHLRDRWPDGRVTDVE